MPQKLQLIYPQPNFSPSFQGGNLWEEIRISLRNSRLLVERGISCLSWTSWIGGDNQTFDLDINIYFFKVVKKQGIMLKRNLFHELRRDPYRKKTATRCGMNCSISNKSMKNYATNGLSWCVLLSVLSCISDCTNSTLNFRDDVMEEIDVLRVEHANDVSTIQELRMCLEDEKRGSITEL